MAPELRNIHVVCEHCRASFVTADPAGLDLIETYVRCPRCDKVNKVRAISKKPRGEAS